MEHPFPIPLDPEAFESRLRRLSERSPYRIPRSAVPEHYRRSSVLICFWREADDLRVLLTKRAAGLRGHPGQMSFPGGGLEGDEDWVAAALRETQEEVGIDPEQVEVLGRLDDAWSGAGHLLVPVVGWLRALPDLTLNPGEVEEVHTPSVRGLIEPTAFTAEEAHYGGNAYIDITLRWEGGHVFGLSTNLLIEAIQWGLGMDVAHGPERLASLRSYVRYQAELARNESRNGK